MDSAMVANIQVIVMILAGRNDNNDLLNSTNTTIWTTYISHDAPPRILKKLSIQLILLTTLKSKEIK
jgi:hypothetical protein